MQGMVRRAVEQKREGKGAEQPRSGSRQVWPHQTRELSSAEDDDDDTEGYEHLREEHAREFALRRMHFLLDEPAPQPGVAEKRKKAESELDDGVDSKVAWVEQPCECNLTSEDSELNERRAHHQNHDAPPSASLQRLEGVVRRGAAIGRRTSNWDLGGKLRCGIHGHDGRSKRAGRILCCRRGSGKARSPHAFSRRSFQLMR